MLPAEYGICWKMDGEIKSVQRSLFCTVLSGLQRLGCGAASGCVGLCGLFKFGGLLYGGEEVPIMLFREDWGNGRGAAWNCSIEAYRALDALHRIVGVGPDCFAAYVYEVPAAAGRLVEEFGSERLTNAHNEGLSMLMNVGALGCMCYAGFVGSALIRFCKGARGQTFLYACAVSLLAIRFIIW